MATCFWVGGTATWDNTNTGGGGAGGIKWASASGGASAAGGSGTGGSPGAADSATFDASSGGGTVTVASTINGSNTISTLTAGAFTGTIDFSANNPNITIAGAISFTGTGARKFLMGSGTFTFTNTGGSIFDLSTVTNLDALSVFTASYVCTATTSSNRNWAGGGKTFGSLTINANTSRGSFSIAGNNTFASMSLAAGTTIIPPTSGTTTITTAPTWTGTISNPISVFSASTASGTTFSVASGTMSIDYGVLYFVTGSGGATFSATNSIDQGRNVNWTITQPSVGGGSVGVIGG